MISQNVVLVEGFKDRAFICGILEYLGCSTKVKQGEDVKDPWGRKVKGQGRYGIWTPGQKQFILIIPVEGSTFEKHIHSVVDDARARPVANLMRISDADCETSAEVQSIAMKRQETLNDFLKNSVGISDKKISDMEQSG